MATRFRALSAPIDAETGDRRRFADGAISTQPLPAPLRWVRQDVGGHDNAVVVGRIDKVEFSADEVWVEGVIFDDVDRETLPRLAEDVAEVAHLASNGVIGLSVDLDKFDARPVRVGSDDTLDMDSVTESDQLELLVTSGRIRSATLVAIPAFSETNHTIELTPSDDDLHLNEAGYLSLVASLGVKELPIEVFTPPVEITGPTPITYDWGNKIAYGHIYQHNTCHVGITDRCAQPPVGEDDYALFHIHPVQTTDGVVYAGRLTAGGGHAPRSASLPEVRREHDKKVTVAYVRAYEDAYGIMVCGPLESDLDEDTMSILSRRKVSGHWAEAGEAFGLGELLALPPGNKAISEPGFPIGVHVRDNRVVGMVASLGPEAEQAAPSVDYVAIGKEVLAAVRVEEERQRFVERERAKLAAKLHEDELQEWRTKLEGVLGDV